MSVRSVVVSLRASVGPYITDMNASAAATERAAAAARAHAAAVEAETVAARQGAAASRAGDAALAREAAARQAAARAAREQAAAEQKAAAEAKAVADKRAAATRQVGTGMLLLGAGLAVGVGAAVKAFMEFDKEMSLVQTLSKASAQEMQGLTNAAMHAGTQYGYTAVQVAQAEQELVKAGVSVKDIMGGALTGALTLAAAGQMDVASATEIATVAMTQFHLRGQDIPHVADLLSAGADKALGSVEDLGNALKWGGLQAAAYGWTLDETVGTLALFAQNGLMGQRAGTAVNVMFSQLVNPTKQARVAMDAVGFSVYDANGKLAKSDELARRLQHSFAGLSDAQRNQALATIFGSRAMIPALILLKSGAQGVQEWHYRVNDAAFATDQARGKLNNLSGDLTKLHASFQNNLIEGGSGVNTTLRSMTKGVTGLIDGYGKLPKPIQQAVVQFGLVGTVLALTGGAFLLAAPKILAAREALVLFNGTAIGTRFAALGLQGGPIAAILALAAAADIAGNAIGKATATKVPVDDLAASLTAFGKGGALAGTGLKMFDTGWGPFINHTTDAKEAFHNFGMEAQKALGGNSFNRFMNNAQDFGQQTARFQEQVAQIDTALATMVGQGNVIAAGKTFDTFMQKSGLTGDALKKLRDEFPKYHAATIGVADGNTKMTDTTVKLTSAQVAAKAASDAAEQAMQKQVATNAATFAKMIDPVAAYTDTLKTKNDAEQKTAQATADATKSGKDSWKDYAKSVDVSVGEYLTALGKQVKAAQDWQTNLAIISSKVSSATLQSLIDMGVQGAPIVAKLVHATGREYAKLQTLLPKSTAAGMANVADVITRAGPVLHEVARVAGQKTADGYVGPLLRGEITLEEIKAKYAAKVASMHDTANTLNTTITTIFGTNGIPKSIAAIDQFGKRIDGLPKEHNITLGVVGTAKALQAAGLSAQAARNAAQGRAFGGMILGPGGPRDDMVPIRASHGEFIVNAAATSANLPLLEAINNGFANGGRVLLNASTRRLPATGEAAGAFMDRIIASVTRHAAAQASAGGMYAGPVGGSGVTRWAPLVRQVLAELGLSASWVPTVLRRMNQESGGNPKAINLWDSNAKMGQPSQGLMQTIPGTFRAYAGPFAGAGITNPHANIYAGLNYAMHRYGSLGALNRPGGYKAGGAVGQPVRYSQYRAAGGGGVSHVVNKKIDVTITAAPNIPTADQVTKALSQAETLMGV